MGHARNRSRTACFNERFLKQAILGSKQLAEKQVDTPEELKGFSSWFSCPYTEVTAATPSALTLDTFAVPPDVNVE